METEWPRMTVESLKDCNKKYLAQMAKDQGIVGWHAMRKDQLIRALTLPPAAAEEGPTASRRDGGRSRGDRRRRPPASAVAPASAGPAARSP